MSASLLAGHLKSLLTTKGQDFKTRFPFALLPCVWSPWHGRKLGDLGTPVSLDPASRKPRLYPEHPTSPSLSHTLMFFNTAGWTSTGVAQPQPQGL